MIKSTQPPFADYKVVEALDSTSLEEQVRADMRTGWVPAGGVHYCMFQHPDSPGQMIAVLHQALALPSEYAGRRW